MVDYSTFLESKAQNNEMHGFDPLWIPDFLFDFQKVLVEWAIRKGRGALFADCGLGKTPIQLVWAENVRRHAGKSVLILAPLAVSYQTIREGEKFGIKCTRSRDGRHSGGIIVTNYQRLHHFDPNNFSGVVGDESSCLKNADAKTRHSVTEFMRTIPYRLLCTATAAPNDYFELGTSSEALGWLGFQDMLTMFFKEDIQKDHLGWGRKSFRFRGHAQTPFWKWVCSWARACRKPSDLGFEDSDFVLPPLRESERVVASHRPHKGLLVVPSNNLREQQAERRYTLNDRCEAVAEMVGDVERPFVVWCHLNPEADLIEELIPDAVQVSGSMSDDLKEDRLLAFTEGRIRVLVTKPKIGCFGLNWQHCNDVICFPSHSYEQYYQAVRRCWRFGQRKPVNVIVVTTMGEQAVMRNLQRKSRQADEMFDSLVSHMWEADHVDREIEFEKKEKVASWL